MLINKLHKNKDMILKIAQRYHANNVRVFGSVARGEEHKNSDIDLLVSFQSGASLLDQAGLMDELSALLGKKVDVVSDRALNQYIRKQVTSEALPL